MGEAADPLDGDEDEFWQALEFAEILQIDMDIAEGRGREAGGGFGRCGLVPASSQVQADKAAPDRAA